MNLFRRITIFCKPFYKGIDKCMDLFINIIVSSLDLFINVSSETDIYFPEGGSYWLVVLCVVLLIAALSLLVAVLYCHRSRGHLTTPANGENCRHHDDEKSNNLQNEENLRR